jgi:hypothetical protein
MLFHLLLPLVTSLAVQHPLIHSLDSSTEWCSSPDDIFIPHNLTLTPDPPQRGQKLSLNIQGTLLKPITDQSIAHIKVKLGFIQLVDQNFDLCEQTKGLGKECPISEGPFSLEHDVDIPNEVPPVCFMINSGSLPRLCAGLLERRNTNYLSQR